jgi:uncharacterized membrane protein (DUF2068 family)
MNSLQHPKTKAPLALRTVALIEGFKGVLACMLGVGLLSIVHRDLDDVAERATEILHVNPEGHISDLLSRAADWATKKTLVEFGIFAFLYATIRFYEAYGLWRARTWGEWIALTSGCLYLPLEIDGLIHHPRPLKWVLLGINLLIVGYILIRRSRTTHFKARPT